MTALIDDWYRDHEDKYIQEKQIAAIKAAPSKYCVNSVVDKSKADLAFSCPLLHQYRMLQMHIDGNDIYMAYDMDNVIKSFAEMKDLISYSGLPIPIRSHEFGAAAIIPKDSNLQEKSRPLGSYFRHAGRYCLSTCCKCLNFGHMAIMLKHLSDITISSEKS